MSNDEPGAGWFPDPRDPEALRYWDGSQWTAHTHARPEASRPEPIAEERVPLAPPSSPQKSFAPRFMWLLGTLLILGGGGFAAMTFLGSKTAGDAILLGTDVSDGDFELFALDLGEQPNRDNRVLDDLASVRPISSSAGGTPGLIGGHHAVILREDGDDEDQLVTIDPRTREFEQLYDTDQGLVAEFHAEADLVTITTGRFSPDSRCLVSGIPLEDPLELSDRGFCSLDARTGTVTAVDSSDGSASIVDFDGTEVWSDDARSVLVASSGDLAAVVDSNGNSDRIEVIDIGSAETVYRSRRYDQAFVYGFVDQRVVVSVRDGDDRVVGLLDASGLAPLVEADAGHGEWAYPLVGEESGVVLVTLNSQHRSEVSLFQAAPVTQLASIEGETAVAYQAHPSSSVDDFVVVTTSSRGTAVHVVDSSAGTIRQKAFFEDREVFWETFGHDAGFTHLVLSGWAPHPDGNGDGVLISIDQQSGDSDVLLERSSSFSIRSVSESNALFTYRDGSDTILATLDAGLRERPIKLDEIDDGHVGRMFVIPDGRILYNVTEDGTDEVRIVRADRGSRPEVAYVDAHVLNVGWTSDLGSVTYLQGD